jgi:[ribosomal protein S5]-alanine N-acetyltransferase
MNFDVYFRGLQTSDAAIINQLRLNEEYQNAIVGSKRFVPLERDEKWIQDIILRDDTTCMYMAVCEKKTNQFVGYTSIHEIDYINGKCFWSGIKIVPEASGKGYGTQVALLVLKYVFEELRLVRCRGECSIDNHRVKRVVDKVGFKTEGVMRSYSYKNGALKDGYMLSVVLEDYKEIKKRYGL